jgi:XamI restriction endonuclease
MSLIDPPRWTTEQLEVDRRAAISLFRDERMKEPLEKYLESFDHFSGVIEDLLELTVDLSEIAERGEDVLTDPDFLYVIRYLAGPMISEADLKTLTDASLAPTMLRADKAMRQTIIETVLMGLDRRRFAWVSEGREPNESERQSAVLATASLIATQRVRTDRANESAAVQQDVVALALIDADFSEVSRRTVSNLKEAPDPGEFCRSGMFGSRDADLIIGLWDGRVMPIECKVSNSSTNSVKRLNNDAAVKASTWVAEFGKSQTVPGAVLSGVYKRHNLEAAQKDDLTLFWAYKLDTMLDWIALTE